MLTTVFLASLFLHYSLSTLPWQVDLWRQTLPPAPPLNVLDAAEAARAQQSPNLAALPQEQLQLLAMLARS